MKWHDIEQNSDEWLDTRRGKFTASVFGDLLSGKTTTGYDKLISRIAFERLTDESPEFYTSPYMGRGHELEPLGVMAYEMIKFETATNGGFFELDEWTGASPDRLIGEDGILQVKCPAYNTMINYIRSETVPPEYRFQLQGELFVTGRKWVDFMAFHPNLPCIIIRVLPDDDIQARIALELEIGKARVLEVIEMVKSKQGAL